MIAIRSLARRYLGDSMIGSIDYYRFPAYREAFGGPFNGQSGRVQIFQAIVTAVQPTAIIETGTYRGVTTEFMAATGLPIHTIEALPRNYGFARARLLRHRNVALRLGDSRTELRKLFDGQLASLSNVPLFVYLDAHWNEDLPLAEEIDIVFGRSPHAVVMIDDFEVPGDPGFAYDDYGPGKTLNAEYISPLTKAHNLAVFYPSVPSQEETGGQRGCVVLCKTDILGSKLQTLSLLRLQKSTPHISRFVQV